MVVKNGCLALLWRIKGGRVVVKRRRFVLARRCSKR